MIFNNKIKLGIISAIIALSGFLVGFYPSSADAFANLVPNPSLETASTTQAGLPYGWRKGGWGTNTRVLTYPVAGRTGEKAVKTEITSYTSGDAKWYFYPVPVVAGEQYEFSDYYISDIPSVVTLQLQMADGTYKYPDIGVLPPASDWQNSNKTFTVPDNVVALTVFHLIKSTGYIIVDDYSLTQIEPVPPPASSSSSSASSVSSGSSSYSSSSSSSVSSASSSSSSSVASSSSSSFSSIYSSSSSSSVGDSNPNLVPNPSLETASTTQIGLPYGWRKGGWGTNTRVLTYPVSGRTGEKAVKTEITSYTSGDAKWYFYPVPVVVGQQYEFSDYYMADIPSYVTVQINMIDGTTKYIDIATAEPSETWHSLYGTFVVPPGAVSASVFHIIKSVGYLTVDDYSLTKVVPDPDNIIYNGSLEVSNYDGSKPDGWNTNRYGSSNAVFSYKTGYGLNGSKGAKIEVSNYVSGDAKWYSREISVSGGEEYLFSDYYMSSAPSNTTVQFRMANGSYTYLGLMNYTPSPKWKKAESTFIVPEGSVAMSLFHVIKGNGYFITDNYSVKKLPSGKFSEGMVTLDFDDGFYSVYENALPILNAVGIKSSQYIVSGFLTDSFYVNPEEAMSMFNSGHEIGSHTINHINLTGLGEEEMRNEVFASKAEIEAIGVPSVKTFVYPFGGFNDDVRQAVIDAGYVGARSVFAGYNTKNSDKFSLKDQHVESDVSVEQIKSYIDRAVADKTWLILELHATDYSGNRYSNTPETLRAVVDYLVSNNVKVVTTEEGIALMSQ